MNVLFLLDDQHINTALSCLRDVPLGTDGMPLVRTPNLDRLCAQGVRFASCYTPTAICGPSRTSIFTGTLPRTHRHFGNRVSARPDPSLVSMVETFKDHGYSTGLFGKDHLPESISQHFQERQRGSEYFSHLQSHGVSESHLERDPTVHQRFLSFPSAIPKEHSREVWTADRAIEFLDAQKDNPWFAWVSFERPHCPHSPDAETESRIPPERVPLPFDECEDFEKAKIQSRPLCENFWNLCNYDPETYQKAVARYYSLIELIDEQIGRILDHLDETGQTERTLIFFTPDHGDFGGRYGQLGKNLPAYEELIKVPLIWKDPASPEQAGHVVQGLWSTVDIFPSLMERLGWDCPPAVEGRSFLDALRGKDGTEREYVVAETVATRCLRTRDYKIVVNPRRPFDGHLFKMTPRPDEMTNLWHDPSFRNVREKLLTLLLHDMITAIQPLDFDPNWEPLFETRFIKHQLLQE